MRGRDRDPAGLLFRAPSIWSYARNSPKYFVIAAVSVVTITVVNVTNGPDGDVRFRRSNFAFAIMASYRGHPRDNPM